MVSKKDTVVALVGLGYVGLPLACAFAKKGVRVIGFDVDSKKINQLKAGRSFIKELTKADILRPNLTYTSNAEDIKKSNFVVVTVPTPITKSKKPDLSFLKAASRLVGENLMRGSIVVYESTVYPGVTEDICAPILEKYSGMCCGADFGLGYSPERINPGDDRHTIDKIVKVVAGGDAATTSAIAKVYGWIITAGIHRARDIRTAEAAKVIENIQRDLNIALMNELSLIFDRLGIDTRDVIEAAGTKWNFHKYYPGLVGGHCIPIDPYYLVFKAKEQGYDPKVILAGRSINDYMAQFIAEKTICLMRDAKKKVRGSKVLILGLTFKENVPDLRTTPAKEIVSYLKRRGIKVLGHDPLVSQELISDFFGISPVKDLKTAKVDAVILSVVHDEFRSLSLKKLVQIIKGKPVLVDVRGFFDPSEAQKLGFLYKQL